MRIIELFAGIGACSKALENLGIDVEILDAVEIDKYAIKSFNAIHGTNFEVQDIKQWDKDFKDVDIITHGSPCFLAGEKVNTKNGFKNIENIIIGDYVKSHDGSYNKVIKTMKNKNNIIYDICCSATHNINTTYNHPFYVLRENNLKWLEANELTTRDFMCIPKNKCQNEIDNNNSTLPLKSIRFWYLIGRFIGDGWVTKRKERNYNISGIKICCAKEELEDLENKLCNILDYCVVEDKSTYKLQFTNKELGEFCSEFGIGAKNKHIPQWVLDLKTEYLKYLLMGILESDGCYSQNRYKVTTISRDLAYNIGELVLKVKNVPYHIYKTIRPTTHKIEERIVNQNNTYQITWSNIYNKNINFIDDDYLYSRVRKINSREEEKDVYNIEVKNTHTYCVNNIAVHNCQDFSIAGNQAGGDIGSGTRSSLMYETIRIVGKIRPKYVLWENVKNILSKRHKHNFDNYINTMKALGYNSYYQVLNAKDYGIPQNRERVYTLSIRSDIDKGDFKFPCKEELKLKLKDMLEEEVDEKYYLSEEQINRIKFSTFCTNKRRIQEKEYSDTLCARDWKDPKCVRIGGIFDTENSKHQAGSIYDKDGISPTLDVMQGGYRQPSVVVNDNNIYNLLFTIFDLCCIINTKEKDKYERSRELLQILWKEIGKKEILQEIRRFISIQEKKILQSNLYENELYEDRKPQSKISTSTPNSSEYNESITNREKMFNMWKNWKIRYTPQRWELSEQQFRQFNLFMQELSHETTQGETSVQDMWQTNERFRILQQTLFKIQEIWRPNENKISNGLRIRKLTPRETFRLMGFDDEDFEKAQAVPTSNTQLYKQARKFNRCKSIRKNIYKFINKRSRR